VWKRSKSREPAAPPQSPEEATREALEHCWDDVSSLRMLGAAPLNDLAAASPAASGEGRARGRRGSHHWGLVMVVVVVLTLAVTIAETFLRR
jgi:hypothetical protein